MFWYTRSFIRQRVLLLPRIIECSLNNTDISSLVSLTDLFDLPFKFWGITGEMQSPLILCYHNQVNNENIITCNDDCKVRQTVYNVSVPTSVT